nr:unnamed protein product [Digitaria exilis]
MDEVEQQLSKQQIEEFREAFSLFDKDGDGEGTRSWKTMGVTQLMRRASAPPVQSSETHSATFVSS